MFREDIQIRNINLNNPFERREVEGFLKKHGLILEEDVDYTVGLYYRDFIIGTGSLSGNVLKSIAIDADHQGESLSNRIISILINQQYKRGNTHLFIFTKPEYRKSFEDMGFKEIEKVDDKVTLLENDPKGIKKYVEKLQLKKVEGYPISSIVMNCNPFTLGHQYLIEEAAKNSHVLHVFLVWENRSIFPNDVRLKLLKEGTKHLNNVVIHKGEDYIISSSTFPSYFIKDKNSIVKTHATLDVKIFGEYITPALGITHRIVGEEPNDTVTNEYNKIMKRLLPEYGVKVIEIPRLKVGENIISASRVRKAIKEDRLESMKMMVPRTTYEYIVSEEAKPIIERIKKSR